MDLDKVLNEELNTLWNNAHFGAASEAPRKDYVGFSSRDGYNFPYQHNAPSVFPPSGESPAQTSDLPWPLGTVTEDLADSFVYLVAAVQKMKTCLDQNPSLSPNQKKQVRELLQSSRKTLESIKTIGGELLIVAQLAGPLPPQIPGNH